ncbi:MAG: CARDB domain-containing protein [Pyrinomonadaceae bacterium]
MKKVIIYLAALSFIVFLFLITGRFGLIAKMQSITSDDEKLAVSMCVTPPANMVAWYPGDGNANDIIGGNNGTLQNGATFAAGMVEQAFSFNGSNGFSVPSTPALNPTEAITLSSWVKPSSYPNEYPTIIRKQTDNQQNVQYLIALSGLGQAHCNIGGSGLVGGFVHLNQWSHVACSYDRQTAVLYVNGFPVASGNFTAPIPTANTNLGIGTTDFPDRGFNGLIDEVSIYNRALSQPEILADFNARSAGKCKPFCVSPPANTVAWFPGDGNANDIIGGTNGTLQNGATFEAGKVGQAFSFDGVDDYVEFSDRSSLDISENLTIDVWIKPSVPLSQQAAYARIVDKLNFSQPPNTGYILFTNGNSSINPAKLCFEFFGTNGTQANVCTVEPDLAPTSTFTHVTGVYNQSSGIMRLYVNGQEKGTANVGTLTISTNNVPLRLGNASVTVNNGLFKGAIDEVSIYNRALSQSEIQAVFDADSAGKCKPGVTPNRIAFTSSRNGNFDIYTINPNGTNEQRVTTNTAIDDQPSLSSDGTRIAFRSTRNGNNDIYVINTDGTNEQRVTNNTANNYQPSFSPDGTRIAFRRNSTIYVINVDGTNEQRVTTNTAIDGQPSFSPNGTRIAFTSGRPGYDIYTVNVDGTNEQRVTNNTAFNFQPSFSPDGTRIAFESSRNGNDDIYVINVDGTNEQRVTTNTAIDDQPSFSPDGTRIAFNSNRNGTNNNDIYTINPDGTNEQQVTTNTADDLDPSWRGAVVVSPTPNTPDLQVTTSNAPAEVETDNVFDVSWTDKNSGQAQAVGPWVDKVYFSIDNQLGNDTLLGDFPFTGSLDPNQTSERIQSINIPRSVITQNGDYFLIVQTDANNNINEGSGENNNIKVRPIRVNRQPLPDLLVENIEAPLEAFFDQTIAVQWRVKNIGNAPTNAAEWTDQIFLSTDATISSDDSDLGGRLNVSYLNANESYVAIADINIPRGVFGSMYLIVKTDNNNNVGEGSETNNARAKAINIQIPPLPDLKVTNVIAPEETFVGGQIALTYRVENQGNRDTSPAGLPNAWVDGVYLSQDQVLNEQTDRRVGECPRAGNLAQTQGYNANCTVNTPADIAGNWYVFVKADDKNAIYEFVNENNNNNYDRVQPGSPMVIRATPPDLIVPAVNAPATGTAARNVTVSWTVRNQGAFDAAPSWFDRIYLSDDAVFSPTTDTPLATVARGVLVAAGQEYNATAEVRLPSCISGTKYIFVMTDSLNQIFEYDPQANAEQNNASTARTIAISMVPADLRVTSVSNPNVGNAGQPIQVGWTVTNNGTGATIENTWYDQVYLSPTATFNQNTALSIGTFTRQGNLNQGESYARTENVIVPNQAQGNYFVFVKTDANDSVEECANDENNLAASTTQININNNLPDLRISSVNPIGNTVAGSTITVNWTGQNAGTAPAQNSARSDAVYFSTNNTLDGSDQRLASTIISGTLAVGASYQAQAQVTIPIVAPGSYFLIIKADDGNYVFEGQYENNNATAAALTIVVPNVDLQVSSFNAPATAYSGQTMNVTWTVINAGMNPTAGTNWTDYVYLSRDQILDPTDQSIGYLSRQGRLLGGQSYNAALDVFVPAGFTGQWYLFVVTDNNNQIAESSENNNTSSGRSLNLQLTPPADLIVSSVTAPTTAKPGETATFQWTIQNNGANAALGLWTDSVYLSTDAAWSINDVLVGQDTRLGPVNAGQSYNASLTVNLPAVNLGQYYVIVRTDTRNRVRETDEANNTGVSSGQTNVDVTQLQLGTPLNTTLTTGQERFYRTNTPANETVRFSVIGQGGSSNELFTRFGAMASRSQYDFLFNRPNEPDQEIVVPNTQAGNYFNLLRGEYVSTNTPTPNIENVTVKAEIIPFSITSVSPNRIGDNGQVTLTLNGAKFQNGATVKLVRNGTTLTADKVTVVNSATVKARFIFTNAPHGVYDVVLTNPGNANTTATQVVTIEKATQMLIQLAVNSGTHPRVGGKLSIDAQVNNIGNVDVPYSMISIKVGDDVSISTKRPIETLPRHADMEGPESEKYRVTNFKSGGKTYDNFVVRNIEVGQEMPFIVDVAGYGARTFRTNLSAKPMTTDQFTSKLEDTVEGLRQYALSHSEVPLSSILAAKINNSQQWWGVFQQDYISLGYLDYTTLTLEKILMFSKENQAPIAIEEGCPEPNRACLEASRDAFYCPLAIVIPGAAAGCVIIQSAKVLDRCTDDFVCYEPEPSCVEGIWNECRQPGLTQYPLGDPRNQPRPCKSTSICPLVPSDPNDKVGPSGFSPQAFIATQQQLPYTINFENVSTATAHAQRIRVVDQLDPNLDWRTFRLKEIGFGSYRITVPENRAFFQQRIQLGAEFNNLLADINAGVDIATGKVTWTLTAIDPATGEQPNGASLGLLPPNNAANDGQGFVTYTVKPKTTAPTGTLIRNNAIIIFDTEAPITTNTVSNTLDADLPISAVNALPPTQAQTTFTVSWAGQDPASGSGLQSYDIWVSENDAPYQPFLSGTTETSAQFTGQLNKTYRFYSIARDNAGNVEAKPDIQDAIITIANQCPVTLNPTSANVAATSGTGSFAVTANTACAWTAISNNSWITITSGNSGNGNGTIGYSVTANSGIARTGTITITGQTFTVNQAAPSYEADVVSRPNGDGSILSDDVVQIRRFLNGTNTADQTTNEFQRADSAPFATRGDGRIFSDDVVQARRYQNGTNPKQTAAGPMTLSAGKTIVDQLFGGLSKTVFENAVIYGVQREVRIESARASAGQTVTVNIRVDSAGDESEYGFVLSYDSGILSNPVIGAGSTGASVRSCNASVAGQINCSVGGFADNNTNSADSGIGEVGAGTNQVLMTVTFTVAANAAGDTPLTLSNVNASSDAPQLFTPTATNGTVTRFSVRQRYRMR